MLLHKVDLLPYTRFSLDAARTDARRVNPEIEIIETLTREYMDRYGYERMTRAKAKITPGIVIAARERSEALKQKAWADLAQNNFRDYALRRMRADYIQMLRARLTAAAAARPAKDKDSMYIDVASAAVYDSAERARL